MYAWQKDSYSGFLNQNTLLVRKILTNLCGAFPVFCFWIQCIWMYFPVYFCTKANYQMSK